MSQKRGNAMSIKEILFLAVSAAWVGACSSPGAPSIPAPNTDCTLDGGGFPMTQAMSDLCCDKVNHVFKIDPGTGKPPAGCPVSASTSVNKNEGELALEILKNAARTLNNASDLTGKGAGIVAGSNLNLAATAGKDFVDLPQQKLETPKLNLNRKLTASEERTLQRNGSGGSALKADTGGLKKPEEESDSDEAPQDGYSSKGSTPVASNNAGDKRKRLGSSIGRPGVDVLDLDDGTSADGSGGVNESDLNSRNLAGLAAPEDYFQRPDTRVERSLFYRITQVHQRNLLQWARKSIKP